MPRSRRSILKSITLGLLSATAFTLTAMLLLAGALLLFRFSDRLLNILNQIVKLLAVVLGVCAAVPRGSQRGFATGLLVALAYMAIGYALYALLGGARFSAADMLGEMLLGAAAGGVTGTIRANMSSRRRTSPRPIRS